MFQYIVVLGYEITSIVFDTTLIVIDIPHIVIDKPRLLCVCAAVGAVVEGWE